MEARGLFGIRSTSAISAVTVDVGFRYSNLILIISGVFYEFFGKTAG